MAETIQTILTILTFLGLFAAALVNHISWRRRFNRCRSYWMELLASKRKDFDRQLVQQSMDYNKRIRNLAHQNMLLRARLREKEGNPDA